MAETASILSPDKTILLPRPDAGCPMADMVTPEALKARIDENPSMPVVTYVNSTAAVKLNFADTFASFAKLHMTNHGITRH